jgi:uncharacterized membrane protein
MDSYNNTDNRSILRTLSYRLIGAVVTALIVFAFTGKLALAVGVGSICLIAKTILYYLHERLWAFIDSRKSKP